MEITIRFDPSWTLFEWKARISPVQAFLNGCRETFGEGTVSERETSGNSCVFSLHVPLEREAVVEGIRKILSSNLDISDLAATVELTVSDTPVALTAAATSDPKSAEPSDDDEDAEYDDDDAMCDDEDEQDADAAADVMARIDNLVGCEPFKAYAHELELLSGQPNAREIYNVPKVLLFSISSGNGYHSMLRLLYELLAALDLSARATTEPAIMEMTLETDDKYPAHVSAVDATLSRLHKMAVPGRVLSLDISNWLPRTNTSDFKKILLYLEEHAAESTVVFRMPYIDAALMRQVSEDIGDILLVKPMVIPPLSEAELQQVAAREFTRRRFVVDEEAWAAFFDKIAEEKLDGSFFGLRTVRKVVNEIVYAKSLANARDGKSERLITVPDISAVMHTNGLPAGTALEQLNGLIGMEPLKRQLLEIVSHLKLTRSNPALDRPTMHMRFVGNPGTGKTTVARILGKMLKEEGLLRVGRFYEIKGRDLCGRYIGETAPKTTAICRDAYGSVLFIDEAYALYGDGERDFGAEAITTLIAEMENHRDDLVVILAGYPADISRLLKMNAGMAMRIPHTVSFRSYSRSDLYRIFCAITQRAFCLEDEAARAAEQFFLDIPDKTMADPAFGNARFSRNFFDACCRKLSLREYESVDGKPQIILSDVMAAVSDCRKSLSTTSKRIGYDVN